MRRVLVLVSIALLEVSCTEPPAVDRPAPRPSSARPELPDGLVSPRAIASTLPDRLGELRASADAEPGIELGLAPTSRITRSYADDHGRRAVLRIIDAARAPELIAGFAAAQQLAVPGAADDDELLPTGIADRPALASWSPAARTSEAQVLVSDRFVVALSIEPARSEDEAVEALEGYDFRALEALSR